MKELIRHILREETTDVKKPFMKYENLINKLVYEIFGDSICGFGWEIFGLENRKGPSIQIVLHFTKNTYQKLNYQRYEDDKQELKSSIQAFLPLFGGIYIAWDTTRCDKDTTSLNENTDKDLSKKIKLTKDLIYDFFGDEVKSIKQSTYDNKPLLKIYYTTDSKAANHSSWLAEKISEVVMEYTGNNLILAPWWTFGWDVRKKLADIYIGCEELKTDEDGDELNETELTERCWKGYTQKGMKTMFGKRYPNCVKKKKK